MLKSIHLGSIYTPSIPCINNILWTGSPLMYFGQGSPNIGFLILSSSKFQPLRNSHFCMFFSPLFQRIYHSNWVPRTVQILIRWRSRACLCLWLLGSDCTRVGPVMHFCTKGYLIYVTFSSVSFIYVTVAIMQHDETSLTPPWLVLIMCKARDNDISINNPLT